MKKKSNKQSKDKFSIELTTTQACNYACEYCFENDCTVPDDNKLTKDIDIVVLKLKSLLDDKWFDDTFETVQLTFWGGEPTLNKNVVNRIVDEFGSHDKVGFYIYTNGSRIDTILPSLIKMNGKKIGSVPKFSIQISYDGLPVHDMRRKHKDGKPTSSDARTAMEILHVHGIEFSLKSTLSHKDFKYLPQIWDNFYDLNKIFGVNYALTVDYHNIEVQKYLDDLEKSMLEIAKKEYMFYKENGKFLSNIFSSNKRFCSAGKRMLTVDVDGQLYLCHGCCYSECSNELSSGNFFEDDLKTIIQNNYKTFNETERYIDECENCVALTCLRCNVKKYECSNKPIFLDRWHDYPAQPDLCLYYKLTGRIGRALIEVLREEKLWDAPENAQVTMPVQLTQTALDTNQYVEETRHPGEKHL